MPGIGTQGSESFAQYAGRKAGVVRLLGHRMRMADLSMLQLHARPPYRATLATNFSSAFGRDAATAACQRTLVPPWFLCMG